MLAEDAACHTLRDAEFGNDPLEADAATKGLAGPEEAGPLLEPSTTSDEQKQDWDHHASHKKPSGCSAMAARPQPDPDA